MTRIFRLFVLFLSVFMGCQRTAPVEQGVVVQEPVSMEAAAAPVESETDPAEAEAVPAEAATENGEVPTGETSCPDTVDCPPSVECVCDEEGNLTDLVFDDDSDGVSDRWYQLDTMGNVLMEGRDTDGDGVANQRTEREFSAEGWLLVESRDFNGDGALDWSVKHTYDESHNRTLTETDNRADGTVEQSCTYTPPCPSPHEDCGRPDCENR